MTFQEAKYHARHNMKSHNFVVVTNDGCIHLGNEKPTVDGHLVKADGDELFSAPEETKKKVKDTKSE